MSAGNKGVIGSLAVHLGIVAAFVGFSWYASYASGKVVVPAEPLLVDLNGVPGRRPGEIGKAVGVAQGDEHGEKKGITRIYIKKLDLEKIERERQQAEAAAQSANNADNKNTSKSTTKNSDTNSSSKTTLSQFLNSKGTHSNGTSLTGGIAGATIRGRNYGTGDNGGDGGSASEQQLYAGEVEARFRSAWTSLIAAEGSSISSTGNCGVTLSVDARGNVTFSGWISRPSDSRLAQLVVQACHQIGNCGTPPGGRAFKIDFTKVGVSDG
jgi:hypothetical protein